MRFEFVGPLFAMLLSLFVTVDDVPSLRGVSSDSEGRHSNPVENSITAGLLRYARNDKPAPQIAARSTWLGCLCDDSAFYAMRASAHVPLASVTKIMTAYLALRELGPDYFVTMSDEAIATEGIAGDLQAGERLTIRDLITMAMTYSSNDAAMALAEALGVAQGARDFSDAIARTVFSMNEEAFALGMRHTFFQNPTGLDLPQMESRGLPGGPSNFSTAEDWVILLKATTAQPLLWDLARDPAPRVVSKNGIVHELLNLNPFRAFPHYVGGKTGTTDLAGENMVMLFERPLGKLHALILFGATPGTREIEAQKLLD